jgi:hypothetical protein
MDRWLSEDWADKHNTRRDCHLQMGGAPHHQGNLSLDAYAERWVMIFVFSSLFIYCNAQFSLLVIIFVFSSQSHEGQECNEFMAYALAHKGKATAPDVTYNPTDGPEAYSNASVHTKLREYTSVAHECYGEDYDPTTQTMDTDLLMRLGGGKQHGRYWMADSTIDSASVLNLAQIRARSTSSSLPIRPRQPSSQQMFAEFHVTTVLFIVQGFYTYTLPVPCLNIILRVECCRPSCRACRPRRNPSSNRCWPSSWRCSVYKPRGRPWSRGCRT